MAPLVAFRADSSDDIGSGHLSRCLNLAGALRMRGAETLFVCRNRHGFDSKMIERHHFPFTVLEKKDAHVSETTDAIEFVDSLNRRTPDFVVLDHYELGIQWESIVRRASRRLLVIDDLPNRQHQCDLFLDQNLLETCSGELHQRAPGATHLLGPKFALLHPRLASVRSRATVASNKVCRVFIFGGGSDQKNLVGKVVRALGKTTAPIALDVVMGDNSRCHENYTSQTGIECTFHERGDKFVQIMANADLALGAGGVTNWERLCIGLPSIVISVAQNQVEVCAKLAEKGFIRYLGPIEDVDEEMINDAVTSILADETERLEYINRGMILVDGHGSSRVAEAMFPSAQTTIEMRRAAVQDLHLYFNWATDAIVRKQSLDSDEISFSDHTQWFSEKMISANTDMYVFSVHGLPIGQVRIERIDGFANISYSLDSLVRGRGWATHVLNIAMSAFRMKYETPFRALVKIDNIISRKVFVNLGFEMSRVATSSEIVEFQLSTHWTSAHQ